MASLRLLSSDPDLVQSILFHKVPGANHYSKSLNSFVPFEHLGSGLQFCNFNLPDPKCLLTLLFICYNTVV